VRRLKRVYLYLVTLIESWDVIGLLFAINWALHCIGHIFRIPWPGVWRVRPRQALYPLTVRLQGSSDLNVLSAIYVLQEYKRVRNLRDVTTVVDLGANVGFSSAFFLSSFPNSRVFAVEPDKNNFEVCRANLRPYGERAVLLHGAVWSECTTLDLDPRENRGWATKVVKSADPNGGSIQAWDMITLIEKTGSPCIDLLKIDIERAELAVFGIAAKEWLPGVRNICIELHGDDCRKVFFDALSDFDYDLDHYDELTICRNIFPKGSSASSHGALAVKGCDSITS